MFLIFVKLCILQLVAAYSRTRARANLVMKLSGAILWDVDGTIANSYMLGYTSTLTVLKNNGIKLITEDEFHEGTRLTTPRRFAWHATGDPDHIIGLGLGEQFDDLYVKLVSHETTPLYAGMKELLLKLSKCEYIALGALSNACGAYVRAVINANDLEAIFKLQYGADDVPHGKPDPAGLLQCSKELNIHPAKCIYIGDSPTDGEAARRAGMRSVGVTWGSHSLETLSSSFDTMAKSIEELEVILDDWIEKNHVELARESTVRRVSWDSSVINNEGMNKLRTDNEKWIP